MLCPYYHYQNHLFRITQYFRYIEYLYLWLDALYMFSYSSKACKNIFKHFWLLLCSHLALPKTLYCIISFSSRVAIFTPTEPWVCFKIYNASHFTIYFAEINANWQVLHSDPHFIYFMKRNLKALFRKTIIALNKLPVFRCLSSVYSVPYHFIVIVILLPYRK